MVIKASYVWLFNFLEMSEQETSGADVANNKAPVVVVEQEQSAGSRHKPFRPTELQDQQPELLHKRSKVPTVPCKNLYFV